MEETFDLGNSLDAPSLAREAVRNVLGRWGMGAVMDDAVLITSELVANAVVHAGGAGRLTLESDNSEHLRIEVSDGDHRPPVRAESSVDSLSGRGLNIIFALASAWGAVLGPSGCGKTVWAELDERPDMPAPRA